MSREFTIGLSIYRVILGGLILKNCIFYLPMADALFGGNAIYDLSLYALDMRISGIGALTYPFQQPGASQLFLLVTAVAAGCFVLAIGGRVVGVVLYFLVIILKLRNGLILDGSDNVIQVTLPFLIAAQSYNYFRLQPKRIALLRSPIWSQLYQPVATAAAYGLMVQVCFVYFFTGLEKMQGELWQNGTATYYTMRVEEFRATEWNIWLTRNHFFVVLTTYSTVLWEQAFAFLVWFQRTKFFVLGLGVLLHVGIWVFMRIDNFSWIMIGTYFVFVTDTEYSVISQWVRQRTKRMAVSEAA
jgi:hypothetical protein